MQINMQFNPEFTKKETSSLTFADPNGFIHILSGPYSMRLKHLTIYGATLIQQNKKMFSIKIFFSQGVNDLLETQIKGTEPWSKSL